ncbi:hypothetical protein [Nocardia sp. NPDC057030]|uniref:hypothetical protein n=1 Tax=unclassified Nocardia TaxID=2637762 RepID=UPI003624CD4E
MRVDHRLRVLVGVLLAALVLVLAACGSKESDSRAPASSTVAGTSVAATRPPASSTPAQADPSTPRVPAATRPGAGDPGQPAAQPPQTEAPAPGGTDRCGEIFCGDVNATRPGGTDNCGIIVCGETPPPPPGGTDNCGVIVCGETPKPVKCTDQIDYTGDPRTPAEINTLGEWNKRCPDPIRPTTTVSPTPQPSATTSVATTPAPTATTTAK